MTTATPQPPSGYTLPPAPLRQTLSTRLTALAEAIAAHPQMQPPARHPTLYNTWDFAMRTHYILSELDNILAGRPIQHPEQVPDYAGPPGGSGTRDPAKAKELMTDVVSRCTMTDVMIGPTGGGLLSAMGLQNVDFGSEVKGKAAEMMLAVMEVADSEKA